MSVVSLFQLLCLKVAPFPCVDWEKRFWSATRKSVEKVTSLRV